MNHPLVLFFEPVDVGHAFFYRLFALKNARLLFLGSAREHAPVLQAHHAVPRGENSPPILVGAIDRLVGSGGAVGVGEQIIRDARIFVGGLDEFPHGFRGRMRKVRLKRRTTEALHGNHACRTRILRAKERNRVLEVGIGAENQGLDRLAQHALYQTEHGLVGHAHQVGDDAGRAGQILGEHRLDAAFVALKRRVETFQKRALRLACVNLGFEAFLAFDKRLVLFVFLFDAGQQRLARSGQVLVRLVRRFQLPPAHLHGIPVLVEPGLLGGKFFLIVLPAFQAIGVICLEGGNGVIELADGIDGLDVFRGNALGFLPALRHPIVEGREFAAGAAHLFLEPDKLA